VEDTKLDIEIYNSLKQLVRSSGIVLLGLLLSKVFTYAYRIVIAKYYGPETYGLFILATAITSLFVVVAAFGLSEGILRFIPQLRTAKSKGDMGYLWNFSLRFSIVTGLLTSIALFLLSKPLATTFSQDPLLETFLKILSFGIIISLIGNLLVALLRAFEEIFSYSLIYNVFQNAIRLATLIIFTITVAGPLKEFSIAPSFVLGSLITLIISYYIAKKVITKELILKKGYENLHLKKEFISYSWPLMGYALVGFIFYWTDTFSIGVFKSALEVGIYNAAVPIATLLVFIPELFLQLFFPMINREYSRGNFQLIKQVSKQVVKWIFIITLPLFILLFSFPGTAINILFGEEFLLAETALRFLLIGVFFSTLSTVCINLISMTGKSKIVFGNTMLAAIINILLNITLVPRSSIFYLENSSGLVGASLATLISMGFLNFSFIIQVKRHLNFTPFRRSMISLGLLSGIPISLLFLLRSIIPITSLSIVGISLFFILSYWGLLVISGALDKNDWTLIQNILRKFFNSPQQIKK